MAQNPDHTITIIVAGNDITYEPAVLNARRGKTVSWFCESGNFTVFFSRTPFEKEVDIPGKKGELTKPARIRRNAEIGVYHYQVAVGHGARILLNAGCPEIIVRR